MLYPQLLDIDSRLESVLVAKIVRTAARLARTQGE